MSNKNRNIGLNFIGIPLADLEWDKNNGLHYSLRPDFIKNQTRCQWDLALDPKKTKNRDGHGDHPLNNTPTTIYFRSTVELAITLRNAHYCRMSKSGRSLPAPPCLDCTCAVEEVGKMSYMWGSGFIF